MGTVVFFLWVKRREREADHSPPPSSEGKNDHQNLHCPYMFVARTNINFLLGCYFVGISKDPKGNISAAFYEAGTS
jgi:hypothetical protein